ncbi:MAG: poly-gamma-glutamate system protein [Planctomycetota bacterium]
MLKLYYRPQSVSTRSLLVLAGVALSVVAALRYVPARFPALERNLGRLQRVSDLPDRLMEASYRASIAYDTIHCRRVQLGHALLDIHDPADTGMIGPSMSLVTSLPGHLSAKQTSVNPNFAAVAMQLMVDAGVGPGDRIAIGCTGSFPALNIAVITAAESLGTRPVVISSAASSQYGANEVDFMWPDMERLLAAEGIIQTRSIMISRGGFRDRCAGMGDETRQLVESSIARSGLPLMDSRDDTDAIDRRMLAFAEAAQDENYAAYINVGGGHASVGGTRGNDALGEGLIEPSDWSAKLGMGMVMNWFRDRFHQGSIDNATLAPNRNGLDGNDCVASRFLASRVPVINMIRTEKLARRFGLPIAPPVPVEVGQGGVYAIADPRRGLAVLGIGLILLTTAIVMRPPIAWVRRMERSGHFGDDPERQPRWML